MGIMAINATECAAAFLETFRLYDANRLETSKSLVVRIKRPGRRIVGMTMAIPAQPHERPGRPLLEPKRHRQLLFTPQGR